MRQIVLDTETTGLDPRQGHRIIEIACLELVNRRLTGRHLHKYLNPDREIDEGAAAVHGITLDFLADKPRFADTVDSFLEFIDGAELLIHNASFDLGFLNHELSLLGRSERIEDRHSVIDTLRMAREMHPGQRNSLDALCKRYQVDNSGRSYHGALLDARLLADVYLAMTAGQGSLSLDMVGSSEQALVLDVHGPIRLPRRRATETESSEHLARIAAIEKKSGKTSLWRQWLSSGSAGQP